MVSNASDDLPDPLTPVMTTSDRAGSVRSTFFRLWVRAPRTTIWPVARSLDVFIYMGNSGRSGKVPRSGPPDVPSTLAGSIRVILWGRGHRGLRRFRLAA